MRAICDDEDNDEDIGEGDRKDDENIEIKDWRANKEIGAVVWRASEPMAGSNQILDSHEEVNKEEKILEEIESWDKDKTTYLNPELYYNNGNFKDFLQCMWTISRSLIMNYSRQKSMM